MTVFKSYAQNFEDIILMRALKGVRKGFYIDIGANDPEIDSVSKAFFDRGWKGIEVEPVPSKAKLLKSARKGCDVIQAAVSSEGGKTTLFEVADTGLSTTVSKIARTHAAKKRKIREVEVSTIPLSEIFDKAPDIIHWLKVDVEGAEKEVIASWGEHEARPWIVVVESTIPNSKRRVGKAWTKMLQDKGYTEVYFDGLNAFFLHEKVSDLTGKFAAPPNFFDRFTLTKYSPFTQDLHKTLKETQSAFEQERELVHQKAGEISKLQHEVDERQTELDRAVTSHETAETLLSQKSDEFDDLSSELEEIRLILQNKQAELEQSVASQTAAATQLAKKDGQIGDLSGQLTEMRLLLENKQTEISLTLMDLTHVRESLTNKAVEVGMLRQQLSEKQDEITNLILESDSAQDRHAELLALYEKLRTDAATHNADIDRLKEQLIDEQVDRKRAAERLISSLRESTERESVLSVQLTEARVEFDKLGAFSQLQQDHIARLEAGKETYERAHSEFRARFAEECANRDALIATLRAEEGRLHHHIAGLNAERTRFLRSLSWRVTKPMRASRRLAHRLAYYSRAFAQKAISPMVSMGATKRHSEKKDEQIAALDQTQHLLPIPPGDHQLSNGDDQIVEAKSIALPSQVNGGSRSSPTRDIALLLPSDIRVLKAQLSQRSE